MKTLRSYLCFIAICLLFTYCGSQSSGTADEENTSDTPTEPDEATATTDTPTLIEWNPRYTWEEFAISASHDVFPDDELNNYAIWEFDDESFPVIILVSKLENEFKALIESDDELDAGSFKVHDIQIPAGLLTENPSNVAYDYYDLFFQDMDGDEVSELVISAEVNGMAPAEDGMREVRFVRSLVLTFRNWRVYVDQGLSDAYNGTVGSTDLDVKDPLMSFLNKKYYHLDTRPDSYLKSEQMKSLWEDMGILSEDYNSENRFGKVEQQEDGSYVIYSSFVGYKYFIKDETHAFSELEDVSEDHYPILLDDYQMQDVYTLTFARVDEEEISMEFALLVGGEADEEQNLRMTISWSDDGFWVASSQEYEWVSKEASVDFERISDD